MAFGDSFNGVFINIEIFAQLHRTPFKIYSLNESRLWNALVHSYTKFKFRHTSKENNRTESLLSLPAIITTFALSTIHVLILVRAFYQRLSCVFIKKKSFPDDEQIYTYQHSFGMRKLFLPSVISENSKPIYCLHFHLNYNDFFIAGRWTVFYIQK